MIDRLFVYGTLAPGRPNEHVLTEIPGTWEPATVRGTLLQKGWGAAAGFPGIVLDGSSGKVHGFIFSSEQLLAHWARLDAFEGDGYERLVTSAKLGSGSVVEVYIYALKENSADESSVDVS